METIKWEGNENYQAFSTIEEFLQYCRTEGLRKHQGSGHIIAPEGTEGNYLYCTFGMELRDMPTYGGDNKTWHAKVYRHLEYYSDGAVPVGLIHDEVIKEVEA
jgi:hypothetical protein